MAENVYFPHAVDMRNDLRIKSLGRKYGYWQGYGMWCALLEMSYQRNSPTLDLSDEDTFAEFCEQLRSDPETVEKFIDSCVGLGLIEGSSWTNFRHISSHGVIEQMAYVSGKSKAGKKGADKRWNKEDSEN